MKSVLLHMLNFVSQGQSERGNDHLRPSSGEVQNVRKLLWVSPTHNKGLVLWKMANFITTCI